MNDMSMVIVPKSDQISADDLLAGPMTITITKVSISPGTEQPVQMNFTGSAKFFRPGKSMCRVMVAAWGPDATAYIGRSMTLYCDPEVTFGALKVGGIRISHMTNISGQMVMALTATKGKKKPFVVKPLVLKTEPKEDPVRVWLDALQANFAEAATLEAIEDLARQEAVVNALAKAPAPVKAELNAMMAEAMARFADEDEMQSAAEPDPVDE